MTPVFCCGFECGDDGSLGTHVTASVGGATISTTTVRSGSRALRINGAPTNAATRTNGGPHTSTTRHIGRYYVRFATLPSADTAIAGFGGSFNGPVVRFKQSDSKIYAGVGTTIGASGVAITTGQFYRIDYDYNVNVAGNDACDVQVDGVACGQATAAGVSSGSSDDQFGAGSAVTVDMFVDDVVLSSTAEDYPIGAGYVNHFVPTSDGTHNIAGAADFKRGAAGTDILNATTDSYLLVDDIPLDAVGSAPTANDYINAIAPPNATDYTENKFGPAPGISTPTVAPRAVEVIVETAQAATTTGSFKLNLNDNGTVNTIVEQVTVAGVVAVAAARKHYATAPSTGAAWTAALFNNLRIRFYSADAAPDQYFVAAMIEAEFAPIVAGSRTALNTRAFPLGTEIGMGWRMPL